MRIAHLLATGAVAAGSILFAAAPAQAHVVDVVTTDFGAPCPYGYREIAQLDRTTVCLHLDVPDYKIITDGSSCRDTYYDNTWTEYSVLDTFRVCVRFT
jgi:hypothetical protein